MIRSSSSRSFRAAALGAAVLAVTGVLTGCGGSSGASSPSSSGGASSSGSGKSITIGFSPYNQSAPALVGLAKGVTAYAKSQGATTLVADPNNDPAKQVQQIRSWMQLGQVQAVWALALNPSDMKPLVALAASKHVALLTTGTAKDYGVSSPPKDVSFSIIDYAAYGTAMGTQLAACSKERFGGKGQFLYLANSAGSTGKAVQDAAVLAALKAGAPGASIVSTVDNQGDRLKSQQATLSALQSHPDLAGTVGGIDEATMGPVTAFTQAGKDPSKSCIVGAGGSDEALAAVKAGTVYADVAIQFSADMSQNVDELISMANHPGAKGEQLHTPFKVVKQGS